MSGHARHSHSAATEDWVRGGYIGTLLKLRGIVCILLWGMPGEPWSCGTTAHKGCEGYWRGGALAGCSRRAWCWCRSRCRRAIGCSSDRIFAHEFPQCIILVSLLVRRCQWLVWDHGSVVGLDCCGNPALGYGGHRTSGTQMLQQRRLTHTNRCC